MNRNNFRMSTTQMRKILEGILRVDAQIELPAIYDPEEEAEMAAAAAAVALNIKSEPRDDDDNDGAGAGGAGGASPPPSGSSGGSGSSSSDANGNGTSNGGGGGDEMDRTKAGPSNAQSPLGRECPSQIKADFIPPSPPDSNQGDSADEADGNQTTYLKATTLDSDAGPDTEVANSDKVEETPEDAPDKPEANSTGDTSDTTIDVVGADEEEEDTSEVVSIGDPDAEEGGSGNSGRAEAQFFPAPGVISKKPSRSNEAFFATKSTASSSSSSSGIGGSPKKVIAKRPGGHLRDGGQSAKKAKVDNDYTAADSDSDASSSSDPEPIAAPPSADATLEGDPEYGDDIFDLPNPIPDWRTIHRGQIVTESKKSRLLAKRGQAKSGSIRKYNYKPFESTITGYSKLSTVAAAEEEVDGEWPCPTCGALFARERSLNSHMSRAHNPNARFPCPEGCGKMLSSQTAIQKHLLSHRPEDQWPYQCREVTWLGSASWRDSQALN